MTEVEASTSPPALPRWFGPRASPDDPAVSALIDRVARGAGWADIGGGFNLNLRINAEPPVVLPIHRPWVRRGRVVGLRRLRERLQRTQVRVARPIPIAGCDLVRVPIVGLSLRNSSITCTHGRTRTPTSAYSRSWDACTLRSEQSGGPVRPNPSTTTEPSASCVTRSASHAAGSEPPARRSCIGCAN